MPEGHTIHRLARDLARDLSGAPVGTEWRQDRFAAGARRLGGRVLAGTSAHGKHLFLHWAPTAEHGAEVLHVHLGLFGTFRRHPLPAPAPSDALRIRLVGTERAWDLTGPMICDLREPDVLDEVAASLGPDPLRRDADPGRFAARVRRSARPIGDLLLDQKVVAGIGNVYRAEVLHLAGIHPSRVGRSLSDAELDLLWTTARDQLRAGVRRNRIVTVPVNGRRLQSIPRPEAVHVYKRERCATCDAPVQLTEVGGRSMYACPACQR